MSERGSVSLLAAAAVFLVLLLGLGLAATFRLATAKVQAQTAADAAALAAAAATFTGPDPAAAASRLARANGARLTRCGCSLDRSLRPREAGVEVGVAVTVPWFGEVVARASARAEYRPPPAPALP